VYFNQRIKVYEQYQDNIVTLRQRLEQENAGLDSAIGIVHRVRELAIQAFNDSNQGTNRQQIADEIGQLNENLLKIANTQNPNGEYIFSGYASDKRTYDDSSGSYVYQGDAQRSLVIGPERQMADGDSGDQVFGALDATAQPAGSIGNIFQAVAQLSSDLKSNIKNTASLTDLDKSLERITTVQVSIGARLNALDSQQNLNDSYIVDHKTIVSEISDLNYAEAISQFNLQQTALQAAQQSYAKVKDLSLFNYL
jgi:flagellar hook-associated protein 3 FlgL